MTIEIWRPELEALIMQRMKSGAFRSIEDALMEALETSATIDEDEEKTTHPRTGFDLIQALQASPYRELNIEVPRFRVSTPARNVTF